MVNININLDTMDMLSVAFIFMHLVLASLFIIWIKKNKLLLGIMLFGMMSFLMYDQSEKISIMLLPIFGTFLYLCSLLLKMPIDDTKINDSHDGIIITAFWQIPYWSIISYYVVMTCYWLK
jgi:hypothetical protein